jgi:hypothetical protein
MIVRASGELCQEDLHPRSSLSLWCKKVGVKTSKRYILTLGFSPGYTILNDCWDLALTVESLPAKYYPVK